MAITINDVPDIPEGYDLSGKIIMIHDPEAPEGSSTYKIPLNIDNILKGGNNLSRDINLVDTNRNDLGRLFYDEGTLSYRLVLYGIDEDGGIINGMSLQPNGIVLFKNSGGSEDPIISLQFNNITKNNEIQFPDASGVIALDNDLPVFDSNDEAFAAGLPEGAKYCSLINGNFLVSTVKNSAYPWHHIFEIEIKEDDGNNTAVVDHTTEGLEQVDWGDGTVDTNSTHEYAAPGTYIVKVELSDTGIKATTSCDFAGARIKRLIGFKWLPNTVEVVLKYQRMTGTELSKAFKTLYENATPGAKSIYLDNQEPGQPPSDLTLINRAIGKGWSVRY